jgi:hypothetical protein
LLHEISQIASPKYTNTGAKLRLPWQPKLHHDAGLYMAQISQAFAVCCMNMALYLLIMSPETKWRAYSPDLGTAGRKHATKGTWIQSLPVKGTLEDLEIQDPTSATTR